MWVAGLSLLWFLGGFWTELRRIFWWGPGDCGVALSGVRLGVGVGAVLWSARGGFLVVSVFVAAGPRGAGGSAAAGWPGCCGTPCKTQTRNEDDLC